jgi:hypothetical protein
MYIKKLGLFLSKVVKISLKYNIEFAIRSQRLKLSEVCNRKWLQGTN